MVKKVAFIMSVVACSFSLSGCAFWEKISIGKMYSKAEENGLNYEDTGLLADPYFLIKNRKNLNESKIYPNSKCRDTCKEKELLKEESGE